MADPLIGTCLGGRYRVERILGSGGMGAVYEATQLDIKRRVALKLLHVAKATPAERTRFEREARALTAIHSPHVVEIRDFQIPEEGPPFLVMEFLEGQSLSALVKREGILPPKRVAKIALQVLAGLADVHRLRIVHRDVKPANIVLVPSAALGEIVKLVDFGVSTADVTMVPATLGTAFVGTLPYMAPEQAMGDTVDDRSDVYGVGASMYYACTQRRPVEGDTPAAIVERLMTGRITPVASHRPDLDPAFAAIVDRALAHDPAKRWQTASEMAAALTTWIEGPTAPPSLPEPVAETRVLSAEPARPSSSRGLAAAFAIVALLLALGAFAFALRGPSHVAPSATGVTSRSADPLPVALEPAPSLAPLASTTMATPRPSATATATAWSPPTAAPPPRRRSQFRGDNAYRSTRACDELVADSCPATMTCNDGFCGCDWDELFCGGHCIARDHRNCGACGRACGANEICADLNADTVSCTSCTEIASRRGVPAGTLAACGTPSCLDLMTNTLNCGACGHVCEPSRHETCLAGKCVTVGN